MQCTRSSTELLPQFALCAQPSLPEELKGTSLSVRTTHKEQNNRADPLVARRDMQTEASLSLKIPHLSKCLEPPDQTTLQLNTSETNYSLDLETVGVPNFSAYFARCSSAYSIPEP